MNAKRRAELDAHWKANGGIKCPHCKVWGPLRPCHCPASFKALGGPWEPAQGCGNDGPYGDKCGFGGAYCDDCAEAQR